MSLEIVQNMMKSYKHSFLSYKSQDLLCCINRGCTEGIVFKILNMNSDYANVAPASLYLSISET